eukprot:NODE_4876_length_728_cov_260.813644_g4713_i0.p1 GENE.NODE_4876_length_728_cov_260.813644_g4713_i0~~NODE_4876_length_728_cov_260.813644_g4713_i0.p1  ORF type:complete len:168 (+),score=13.83 NODE_4876_length_728_cov_260.813644_g4713_i0:87-590(+)
MDHLAPQACGRTRGELDKLLKESDYGGNKNAFNAFFVPATNPAERPEILPKCKECSNPIGAHQAAAAGSPRTPTPSVAPDEPDRHPATACAIFRSLLFLFAYVGFDLAAAGWIVQSGIWADSSFWNVVVGLFLLQQANALQAQACKRLTPWLLRLCSWLLSRGPGSR